MNASNPTHHLLVLWLFFMILNGKTAQAQGVGINDQNHPPDSSAMLDVSSTTKGILVPRMTSVERQAIPNPANSLLVFDTETNSFWFYKATAWTELNSPADDLGNHTATTNLQTAGHYISNDGDHEGIAIDTNGSVGIGTNTPARELHVYANAPTARFESADNGRYIDLNPASSSIDLYNANFNLNRFSSRNIILAAGGGNVGIGLGSGAVPSGKLHIGGSITIADGTQQNGYVLSSDNNGKGTWVNPNSLWGTASAAFGVSNHVVQPNTQQINVASDDFVFGSTQLDHDGQAAHDKRFFFDKSKGAFRAGRVSGTAWDEANVGVYSMAWGENNTASGMRSTAWGSDNTASGGRATVWGITNTASGSLATAWGTSNTANSSYSTAWGRDNTASDSYATVWGRQSTASGSMATAWGHYNTASGLASTAWGVETEASAHYTTAWGEATTASEYTATVWGQRNTASGIAATAWGGNNTASGQGSTAFGSRNNASGNYATAWGINNTARSYGETVIGFNSSGYTPNSTTSWNANDRLFTIGNGSSASSRSNALVVLKNGRVGIGTSNPDKGQLHVNGSRYVSLGDYFLRKGNGNKFQYKSGGENVSIYANEVIAGAQLVAHSDRRIKTDLSPTNNAADLNTLMAIQVTDYGFVDQVAKGDRREKKVIAQELKEIYPQAVVDQLTAVVPDIMQLAQAEAGWVRLPQHDLQKGDIVRLVHATGNAEFEVLEVQADAFKVAYEETGELLVYGRQVDDFHTVDYDAVSMLNVSATQAQQQLIEAQQDLIEHQQREIEGLKAAHAATTEALKTYQASTAARLQKLEALLQMSASK